jgi:hypothetical protein
MPQNGLVLWQVLRIAYVPAGPERRVGSRKIPIRRRPPERSDVFDVLEVKRRREYTVR